jgi:hypothetical protein
MDDSDQQPLVGLPAPVAGPALDRAYVEAVAHRVAELIHDEAQQTIGRRLVDAATLAAELGVERSWVYEHADELAPVRLGTGSKPRLRFDVRAARQALAGWSAARVVSGDRAGGVVPPRRRRHSAGNLRAPGSVLSVRPRRIK